MRTPRSTISLGPIETAASPNLAQSPNASSEKKNPELPPGIPSPANATAPMRITARSGTKNRIRDLPARPKTGNPFGQRHEKEIGAAAKFCFPNPGSTHGTSGERKRRETVT